MHESICPDVVIGHNLLVPETSSTLMNVPMNMRRGFGIFDGIWKHQGWKQIKELQDKLKNMKELKDVISLLGSSTLMRKLQCISILLYSQVTCLLVLCGD